MSDYVTGELLVEAVDEDAKPFIDNFLATRGKRNEGHLRISVKEAIPISTKEASDHWWVFTRDYGNPETWEHPYNSHAEAKSEICKRTGMSTREVQLMRPELLDVGDTVYFGGVVSPGGTIIVAFSGIEAEFDELIADVVLRIILAKIEHILVTQREAGKAYYE